MTRHQDNGADLYRNAIGCLRRYGFNRLQGWISVVSALEDIAGNHRTSTAMRGGLRARAKWAMEIIAKRNENYLPTSEPTERPKKSLDFKKWETKVHQFYESYEWKRLRYETLMKQGRKCKMCGITPAMGAVLNVDHIRSIKNHWERRLDPANLQVLCGDCNHGKGNWDQTDWRKS